MFRALFSDCLVLTFFNIILTTAVIRMSNRFLFVNLVKMLYLQQILEAEGVGQLGT